MLCRAPAQRPQVSGKELGWRRLGSSSCGKNTKKNQGVNRRRIRCLKGGILFVLQAERQLSFFFQQEQKVSNKS